MTAPRRHLTVLLPTLGGGGAERVIVTLLRHFDRSLFRLSLVVIDARDAVYRQDVPDDVEFIDLGCRRVRHALPRLRSLLWRTRPDLLLSTLGHMNLAIGLLRPLLPRSTRYFARETAVVSYVVAAQHPRWLWRLAYRFLYRGFDRVICQSADR